MNDDEWQAWRIAVEKRLSSGDTQFENILRTLREIKQSQWDIYSKLDALRMAPAARWQTGVQAFLSAVIAAAVGLFLSKIR